MKTHHTFWLGLGLLVLSWAVIAQDESTVAPYEEFGKHLRAAEEVTPLTSTLFGDHTTLYNGATEFDVTDIDLPGNSHLPVRLSRRFEAADHRALPGNLGGFGDWDVEVPYIDGNFVEQDGWTVIGANNTQSYARCSSHMQPYTVLADQGNAVAPVADVWDGNQLHIPGETDEELLANTETMLPAVQDGKTYPWITKSFYRASCAPSTANGYPGESYVVVSPKGDRYTFNWAQVISMSRVLSTVPAISGKGTETVIDRRSHIFLLATEVDDRFGNWVKYSYNGSGQLTAITANDGRAISIQWTGNYITSATTGSRTWQYGYTSNGAMTYYNQTIGYLTIDPLSSVTRPDGSTWSYAITSGAQGSVHSAQDTEPPPSYHCQIDNNANTGNFVYTINAPSGAQGVFTFNYQRNYRSYVPDSCTDVNPDTMYPLEYDFFDNFALVSKQITGAGLTAQNWTYNYLGNVGGYVLAAESFPYGVETYIPLSASSYAPPKTVTVTDPTGITKYTFGTNYGVDEGRLYTTEVDTLAGTEVRTTTNTYLPESAIGSQAFPSNAGQSVQSMGKNPMVGRLRPVVTTVSMQDGDTYTKQTNAFDVFVHPTDVTRFSSLGNPAIAPNSIEETTSYFNDYADWVIGLPQQVTNAGNGDVESLNTYNPNGTLQASAHFGETIYQYTYNTQGLLASFTDGDTNTTSLSNYYRGIPQLVTYPDTTSQSATVDDYGEITAVTDQADHTTNYQYDPSGWPKEIDYPTGDEVAWYPETYTFTYVTSAEQGIAAGHWRRTVSTGNNTEVTYFDAMLRPILTDTSIPGADISTGNAYDWQGKTTFTSYPVSGAASLSTLLADPGTHNTYDTLERVTQVQQDSELGTLTTITAYLPGAGTQVTDPNSNVTTTYYQVFDEPSYSAPIKVQIAGAFNPNLTTQVINRDVYGKPLSITQSGLYNGTESDSVTKNLYYDSAHRLCRTFEPESRSTLTTYDGANNVQTTASGMTITEAGCGYDQVPSQAVTQYTYYPTNRLKTIVPPAGTQSTQYIYDAVGNLKWATSGLTVWDGSYNYRNMLTAEALNVVGQAAFGIGYSHDAYGHLSVVSYPGGGSNGGHQAMAYAPDALGRPTQVGSYASGITYWPNGQVAGFTYGNGTVYATSQNERQLQSNFSYTSSAAAGGALQLSEGMAYDADANIKTVTDPAGGLRSKSFNYDGLNRLTSAVAPGLSINESYTYDALNNLRSRVTGGQTLTYNYNSLNQLGTITNGATTIDTFGYDYDGNQNTKNGNTLLFDQKDQLTQILNFDSYAYDAAGRRVLKTPVGGSPTVSFYDHGGQLMYQFAPGASQATNFIYLGTKLIARNAYTQFGAPGAITFDSNPNNGNYTVSWGAVPAATTYTLQESFNGGAWTTTNVSGNSYAFTNRDGGNYVYQVQACSGANCGPWTTSATLDVTPALPTLTVPTSLTFAPFTVSWSAPISATSYTVQQSFNGGVWTTVASNTTATSFSVTSAPGGTYTFQVSASNAYGNRGWAASAPVSVTQIPATPTNFVVTKTNGMDVLTWDAMPWATTYGITEFGGGINLGEYIYDVTTNSWSGPAPPGNTNDTFQLVACSIAGCSAYVSNASTFNIKGATVASPVSDLIRKVKRAVSYDTGSGSGCTATACTVTVGGSP
jgi:YD repeat-containing protein